MGEFKRNDSDKTKKQNAIAIATNQQSYQQLSDLF